MSPTQQPSATAINAAHSVLMASTAQDEDESALDVANMLRAAYAVDFPALPDPWWDADFDLDQMIEAGPWKASATPDDGTPPWSIGKKEPMFWFDTHEDAERAVGLLNTLERQLVRLR